jgi:hypothetical protein
VTHRLLTIGRTTGTTGAPIEHLLGRREMVKLDHWSVKANLYQPPEVRSVYLSGIVSGHPNFDDGERISTSRIVAAAGRVVTTRSGRQYHLGRIEPGYRKYLRDNDITYNPKQPVKVTP